MTTSIGPLANPDYYLRMQRSHQAANGYYTGGGEPDGIWWNPAGLLGLQHGATVGTDAFYRLCEGFSPDGEKLTQNAGSGKRSAGLDLTFSADKSVSAVWAVAGERLRTAIADAHTAAVQYTLEHVIEAHCATTRIRTRGLNGARGELAIVPADLIAALFQHGTSRADDPQLHTHCTVMNAARAHFDGKYRALNQYPLYRWKMAAGATYRNHLAFGLRGLGFKVEQHGKDGAFTRIAGVPSALEAHWSKRTAQIEAFARDNGFDVTANPQLHTAANHLTRAPKRDTGDDKAKRARWRAEAQTFSFGEAFIAELRHELSGDITPERLRELTARLEQLPERLTREESVFSYPALAAAVRNATAGLLHPDAAGTALERVLRSEALVRLSPLAKDRPAEAPHLEVEAGMAHIRLYTTRATLEMERAVQDMAERLAQAPGGVESGAALSVERVDEAIKDLQQQGYPLSAEQASAIHHATTGAGRIALIEGAAGSGKTTTLRPIVDLYRERGYRVLGAAIAWRTALALGSDCAMEALAVRKLLAQAARGQLALDGAPTLLVIDEAGLLSTREMHHILALGERHGLTLLFAGDTGQQQPIEAGPGLRLVRERIGSVRVDAMHRQKADVEDIITPRYAQAPEQVRRIAARMTRAECEEVLAEHERTPAAARTITPWQISASEAFRDGDARGALFAYHARGRVHLCPDDEAALARLVSDWARYEREEPGKRTAVLARTNAERRALSARMREVHLPPSDKRTTLTVPVHHPDRGKAPVPLDIAVGERLRIGATHWERRLFNGTIVTVEALEQRKDRVLITGRTDTGRAVSFHHDEIRDYHGRIRLEHGYALTIASAQGLTAERVFLYADAKPARQTIYPAATRHRERLDFYLDRRPLVLDIIARAPEDAAALDIADDVILAYLGERWSRGAPKAAALDYPALPPQLRPRPEGGEAALRPRPAVALDRSITRAARAFRAATREFRDGNTALAVPDVQDAGEAQREREVKAQARLLQSAAPIAAADPAGRYLSGSGLSLDQARSAGLRFHPGAPVTVDGETRGLPALLAPVRTPGGERAAAVHCFHLTPEGGLARIERQTHTRGEPGDGAVWLLNPAAAERVVLCTAIEDALAVVRILPPERQAAVAVAATLIPERAGSIELPPNAREVILVPDDLTGETAWAALKRRCEEKDTAFSVSRWLPGGASLHDVLRLDGPEALTQTLGAALSSPLLHKTCERLHHDWRRHIETAQAAGVLITQAPGYEGLTARLQSMTDALSGHHGPAPEALVLALHQLVRRPLNAALIPHTEALCQRYLGGTARDGRWPFRIIRGKERFPASVALLSPERGTWTNETTGRQGGLLDLIRLAGSHETLSATMMAARDFLEAEHQREAEAQRRLTAALARHAEAFCQRYLPHGAKQDNQWRVPHVAVDKAPYSMTVELLSPEQGAWRLEATSGQGALRDIVQSAREGIRTARALIKGETLERPMYVHLLGPGKAMWQDRMAGNPGDLFDLICHAAGYGDKARGMAAARDFLEGEREARRALAAALAPHAEALCRRFLPESVEVVRLPDVLTVRGQKGSLTIRLSGPERGTWKDEVTGRQGDLLDLIRIAGKHHDDLAATMAAGSAFLETEREARRQLAGALSLYAGAFCRRFLLKSVRTVHLPGVLTVRGQKGSLTIRLSGPERGTWTNETTGRQGDLLDLIRIKGKHENDLAAAMAAGSAFLEAEREARRQLNAELAPHTEALCESYLPNGVKRQDGQWRTEDLTVRLSGPLQGTWRNDMTGRQGDLLDLIHIEGKHDNDMTGTMAAAHTFLHGEAQAALRHDWKAHDARALEAGNPLYHTPEYHQLIGRTEDLVQAYAALQDPHAFFKPQHLEQRIAAHQAHLEASAPLRRHAAAVRAHERLRSEQLGRGGAHPVFSGQYPQWRREAKALIAKGQRLLDTPDPARLAETAWLGKVGKATTNLEQTVRDDKHLHQSRQALNAELEPYTEVICRRNLPHGVKRDGQWRVSTVQDGEEHALTVQLSGAAKGTWEDKAANRRGDLLDLIGRAAADGGIIQAMDAARAFLEAQLRQQHKMSEDLEQKQTKHKSRGHGMSL